MILTELIQRTDDLNTGREKLNNAIKHADKAITDSEEALQTANLSLSMSENTQNQLNQVVIEGDSSVEAAQARVDADNNTFTTLKDRLDTKESQFTAQLAQIAVNVTSLGMDNTGNTDIIPILAEIKDNTSYLFPEGDYLIDSHLTLVNKKNITFIFSPGSRLIDSFGVEVTLEDNSKSYTPNGIRFEYSENIIMNKPYIANPRTYHGRISSADADKRVPNIDFYKSPGSKVIAPILDGYVGPFVSLTDDPAHFMRASFIRMVECPNSGIINPILNENSGHGEIVCAYRCKNFMYSESVHNQNGTNTTFWSLSNIIDCENAKILGISTESESTGSLIDVSGDNIVVEGIRANYPNGKMLDITNEWGINNGRTNNIKVLNCYTNGDGVFTAGSDQYTPIDNVTIDDLSVITSDVSRNVTGVYTAYFKKVDILNSKFHNVRNVLNSIPNEHVDFLKDVVIDNAVITSDKLTNTGDIQLDAYGNLIIKNSLIDLDNVNELSLYDRYPQFKGSDLTNSPTKIIIKDSIIRNTVVLIQSNVEFINCDMSENVKFRTVSTGMNSKPTVTINGKLKINDKVGDDFHEIFLFGSCNALKLKNLDFEGVWLNNGGLSIFSRLQTTNTPILIEDSNINVKRLLDDGTIREQPLFSYNNQTSYLNVTIKNSEIGNDSRLMAMTGGEVTSPNNFSEVNVIDCVLKRSDAITGYAAIHNRLNLLLKGNVMDKALLNAITERETNFNKLAHGGNVGV